MGKSFLRVSVCFAFAALAAVSAFAADSVKWQVQTAEVAGTARFVCSEYFAKLVGEKTGGRLQIELFSADTLSPTMNVMEAVTFGMTPAALTSSDYLAGKEPMLKFAAYRPSDPWNLRFDFDEGLYKRTNDLVRKAYERNGVHYVGSTLGQPGEAFHATVPINKVSDLQGLRVRSAGLGQEMYESCGAAVVVMPMGDVYTALKLSTISAAEIGGYVDNYQLALFEVVKYNIEPAPHASSGFTIGQLIVNNDAWAALPDDLKKIVEECVDESREWSWNYLNEQNKIFRKKFEDAGTTTLTLPPEEVALIKDKALGFTKNYWGRNDLLDQYFEIYIKFLEDSGFKEAADKLRK